MLFTAFFDESGVDPIKAKSLIIGGFLGHNDEWGKKPQMRGTLACATRLQSNISAVTNAKRWRGNLGDSSAGLQKRKLAH